MRLNAVQNCNLTMKRPEPCREQITCGRVFQQSQQLSLHFFGSPFTFRRVRRSREFGSRPRLFIGFNVAPHTPGIVTRTPPTKAGFAKAYREPDFGVMMRCEQMRIRRCS